MASIMPFLKHAWNAFRGRDRPENVKAYGNSYYSNPYKTVYMTRGNERSIVTAIFNRIAMDVASNKIEHVRLDSNGRYLKPIDGNLNNCLTVEANIDQTSRAFFQDLTYSLFDDGYVAAVPTDATDDPRYSSSFEVKELRVAKIVTWYPRHVTVEVYNDYTGQKDTITYPKTSVALIENPFYSIMNSYNSTLQRLIRKLNLLDIVDEQTATGKLDLIIQLPYTVRSESRKAQAEKRRKDIEDQLTGSRYGIAYTDGTERITQLNRPVENNLLKQIDSLMETLYSQLGITPEILTGEANDSIMQNYNSRIVEPILSAIVDEMNRKFLTKTARSQKQAIVFSNDPFRLAPISKVADIAEKFIANAILSPNEMRGIVGFKPSEDPDSDKLRNRRLSEPTDSKSGGLGVGAVRASDLTAKGFELVSQNQNRSLNDLDLSKNYLGP